MMFLVDVQCVKYGLKNLLYVVHVVVQYLEQNQNVLQTGKSIYQANVNNTYCH